MNRLQILTEELNISSYFTSVVQQIGNDFVRAAQPSRSPVVGARKQLMRFPERTMKWGGSKPVEQAKRILGTGDYMGARAFIKQALLQAPDDEELKKFGGLIAPPQVRVVPSSNAGTDIAANRQWLRENEDDYRGQWIALRAGTLVGSAETLTELEKIAGSLRGLFFTRVF